MIYPGIPRLTHHDLSSTWTRIVRNLWSQDDAIPDEDTPARAWRRLFGGAVPDQGDWIAVSDGGDHEVLVDELGRVLVSSYPGANEIGVLPGSPADVYPRLVISGGQTGADRGALDAALGAGWPIGGWAPRGWRAEDGEIPERYRAHLWEAASPSYASRTRDNVHDSDGTLIILLGDEMSTGTLQTWVHAGQLQKPRHRAVFRGDEAVLCVDGRPETGPRAVEYLASWLVEHQIGVLNVAGPRESRQPGISDAAAALIGRLLAVVDLRRRSSPPAATRGRSIAAQALDRLDSGVAAPVSESLPDLAAPRSTGVPTWSASQEYAIRAALRWISDPAGDQVFCLAGVAGSGKSTLVQEIVAQSGRCWLYAAFTGKAALVMERKGCAGARTIHSLIYRPEGDPTVGEDGRVELSFCLQDESPLHDAFGVVVDEGSMLDEPIARDLLGFGKRILVLYDPAQLPPIEGAGFFTGRDPDVMLTEVHRQARDSGILDLATYIREGGDLTARIGWSREDCEVVSREDRDPAEIMQRMIGADQVIVGRNDTRHRLNARYRQLCRVESALPVSGDKVICLRNERRLGLYNGSMWRVLSQTPAGPSTIDLEIESLDGLGALTVRTWQHHFLAREADLQNMGPVRTGFREFDYGYFVTCHKAQGSQWDDVVLYDESRIFRADRQKWLYTGITRAARRLLVVV